MDKNNHAFASFDYVRILNDNPNEFSKFTSEQLDNHMIVEYAISSINGLFLQYASERLKGDMFIVMAAINNNAFAYQYASESLKKDKNVRDAACRRNILVLEFIDDENYINAIVEKVQ